MSEINFVSKDQVNLLKVVKIRKRVTGLTTLVLVIYVVLVSGILGWWWYTSSKEERLSSETNEAIKLIGQYSESEVVIQRVSARAKLVSDFVANRNSAASASAILLENQDIQILSWDYVPAGEIRIGVTAGNPTLIKGFATYLEKFYNKVLLGELSWSPTQGWIGKLVCKT